MNVGLMLLVVSLAAGLGALPLFLIAADKCRRPVQVLAPPVRPQRVIRPPVVAKAEPPAPRPHSEEELADEELERRLRQRQREITEVGEETRSAMLREVYRRMHQRPERS